MILLIIGCTEGEVRLVSGTNYTEGRVEICLYNEWGAVCGTTWDDIAAGVVCRQLGYFDIGITIIINN